MTRYSLKRRAVTLAIESTMASSSTIATSPIEDKRPSPTKSFAQVLTVDIGGSSVKVLASGQTEPRKRRSGKKLTPAKMVEIVQELADARVADDDPDVFAGAFGPQFDAPAGGSELDRVREQVPDDLLQPGRVAHYDCGFLDCGLRIADRGLAVVKRPDENDEPAIRNPQSAIRNLTPLASAAGRTMSIAGAITGLMSSRRRSSRSLPLAMRAVSSRSSISCSCVLALRSTMSQQRSNRASSSDFSRSMRSRSKYTAGKCSERKRGVCLQCAHIAFAEL